MGKLLRLRRRWIWSSFREGMAELGVRYQGILNEILDTAEVPVGERKNSQVKLWEATLDQVRRNPEPCRVPRFLWSACAAMLSRVGAASRERLKRKLMLRAFIEEIPSPEERNSLLRLAYQDQGAAFQDSGPDWELLESLSRSYRLLHEQLSWKADKLTDWSDGALRPRDVAAMTPPFSDFEDWLFET